jgi:putative hemolysin
VISVENIVAERLPKIDSGNPLIKSSALRLLKYLFHESEMKEFGKNYPDLQGVDFVEKVLDYFEFDYLVNDREKANFPYTGSVVAIANHPIGSLDGLALLKLCTDIRPDVKIVANELLWSIKPLRPLLLPVNNMAGNTPKSNMKAIEKHISAGGALLIFPAGEVSRLGVKGIKDGKWRNGFLNFAKQAKAPIVPIHIDGKNSLFFYALSLLAKPLSTLWLIDEMFKQRNQDIRIRIGQAIEHKTYNDLQIDRKNLKKLFKKQVYSLAKKKYQTEFKPLVESVAHPEDRKILTKELKECELLGQTNDGKRIYCYQHKKDSAVMREIGRLREYTFRKVGEGSGHKRDLDKFDNYYDHIVLWDNEQYEIIGAYRLVPIAKMKQNSGLNKLYSETLFDLTHLTSKVQNYGLELGRSFVQPEFWGKRGLDYLWQGIGAYLRQHPEIKYLVGSVTMSNDLNQDAKSSLVRFYKTYFGQSNNVVIAKRPFEMTDQDGIHFTGDDYENEFKLLKTELKKHNALLPTLYKQYSELCEPGGTIFTAFNVDPDFCDCIDGFMITEISKFKEAKRQRYLEERT